jgi:ribosomal protein L32
MRHTSSHTKNRRSHHALKDASIVKDKESGALRLSHRLDETTGMYRGKQIIPTDELKRREERTKKQAKERQGNPLSEGVREPVHVTEDPVASKPAPKEGLLGRFTKGKAKARSGFGGGA